MKNNLKKIVETTILGALTSILSTNAMENPELKSLDFENEDFNFETEESKNNKPLQYNWKPKLLLNLNENGEWMYNSHRSHRSHSSHRSHYSSSSSSSRSSNSSSSRSNSNSNNLNSNSFNSINGTRRQIETHDKVKFKNSCNETINLLVYFKDLDGVFKTKGWYNINPYETAHILNTSSSVFYFYAFSNTYEWTGSDMQATKNNVLYNLKKIYISNNTFGEYTQEINCTR